MYLKISAMNEFFNPKVGLRALFSGPHWLAPYLRQENVYLRKNQKHVTHWVIRCAKKHCQCDNNENDAQGSRDSQKIFSSQRNVYLRRN